MLGTTTPLSLPLEAPPPHLQFPFIVNMEVGGLEAAPSHTSYSLGQFEGTGDKGYHLPKNRG